MQSCWPRKRFCGLWQCKRLPLTALLNIAEAVQDAYDAQNLAKAQKLVEAVIFGLPSCSPNEKGMDAGELCAESRSMRARLFAVSASMSDSASQGLCACA